MSMAVTTSWARGAPMKARNVMTSTVVSVDAETPTGEIARRMLEHHISAVPVLDKSGAPIGMVSEGDLIGRNDREREARRDWWLSVLAEGEALSPEFLASLRGHDRTAGDVMSKPVITVGEDTETGEIARLLQAYRIKRVPVVRDGKMVGIVSRENLLRALAEQEAPHGAKPEKPLLAGVFAELDRHFHRPHHESEPSVARKAAQPDDTHLTVGDFHRLVSDYDNKELQHREAQRRSAAEERRRRVTELIDQHLSDEAWRNLVHQARMTAERGGKEFMLLRFPSQLCSDGGRAINVAEADWPATLRGEAAELYLRWARDLKPHGFHLTARVLDFPGGVPGDVGIFLGWRQ
jgi:CBS domain-containing protein